MSVFLKEAIDNLDEVSSRVRFPKKYARLWLLAARIAVLSYPQSVFIVDDVRNWAESQGLEASDSNRIWGALIRSLKAEGHIVETGEKRRLTYISNSSQKVREWRKVI
jgi:hypothetical protein